MKTNSLDEFLQPFSYNSYMNLDSNLSYCKSEYISQEDPQYYYPDNFFNMHTIQNTNTSQDHKEELSSIQDKSIQIEKEYQPRKKREIHSKNQRKMIKGMIIALKKSEYNITQIVKLIQELGYIITRTHVARVIKKYESTQNIFTECGMCGRDRILKENDVKYLIQEIYHGDVSLKEAAQKAKVSRHTLSRYLGDFGLGVTQYNSKKKVSMEVDYDKIDIKNDDDYILRTSEKIMFPKIQFGQVHQWDRFYHDFYKIVKLININWLGYYQGNKMNGRGCFIVIKAQLEFPSIFKSINQLENYLRNFIPDKFFSSNVMPTNKLRVYLSKEEAKKVICAQESFKTIENVDVKRRVRKCKPLTQLESEFIKKLQNQRNSKSKSKQFTYNPEISDHQIINK